MTQLSCFRADRNGVDQGGMNSAEWTQVVFTTERYDVGSCFSTVTSTWTPPAGRISIVGSLFCTVSVTLNGVDAVAIYKDGVLLAQTANCCSITNSCFSNIAIDDIASGSNAYTMWGYITGGTGRAFNGAAAQTFFCGNWYSA